MDDGLESFLTDPLERRLLAAFRAMATQARVSVVKTVEGWLALERVGMDVEGTERAAGDRSVAAKAGTGGARSGRMLL